MVHHIRNITAGLLAAATLALVMACGTGASVGAPPRQDPNSPDATIVAMIQCFRANGPPNFPDPVFEPSDRRWHLANERPDITTQVQLTCASVMPHRAPPSAIPTAQLHDLLDFAACMRKHGMPNFPDPGIDGVFHGTEQTLGSKQDPVANAAQSSCERYLVSSGGHIEVSNQ